MPRGAAVRATVAPQEVRLTNSRRYRFGELLGEGGFGVVYKAAMLGSDGFEKPVAIKLLRLAGGDGRLADEAQQRFRDEARLLGLLRHRAIVQVDGLVTLAGNQAVIMEFLEGVSLRALVKRGPIPLGPALEIIGEVCAALDAAWHRPGPTGKPLNVCHRDIKPANLQLSADGELKVLDFGIARANFQSREAETRSLAMGSVEYMSPSRLDFDDDGAAGDVYSVGCVLYELLVGEAFGRGSANPKVHADRFAANIVRVPERVRELVGRMLAFDATQRPNAKEIERACLDLARGEETRLRDWAAYSVVALTTTTRTVSGSWTGKTLAEDAPAGPRALVSGGGLEVAMATGLAPTGVAPTTSLDRASAVSGATRRAPPSAEAASGPVSRPLASGPISKPTLSRTQGRVSGPITRSTAVPAEGVGAATKAGAAALSVVGVGSIAMGVILAAVVGVLVWRGVAATPAEPVASVTLPAALSPAPAALSPAPPPAAGSAAAVGAAASAPVEATPSVVKVEAPAKAEPKPAKVSTKTVPVEVADARPSALTTVAATVELSGNAEAVRLRSASGSVLALPKVPAGTYTVLATFDGAEVEAGSLTLSEGETVVLRCKKTFTRCSR